ncbi:MAG TPA: arginase family protein [Candidatus Methylomirabilis sp.]|nr:arginase family protein [Candidatus Methylomirabilis sp.]
MSQALILNFDDSVKPLPGGQIIPLTDRQEDIRFGCRKKVLDGLGREIATALDARPPVVFLGSGDYHHVSYLLIERLRALDTRIQVVVFDNHPDNMRYPFGIHCGSWVWHVSRLPFVARVHMLGITSTDVGGGRLWENHFAPLYSGKVVYWCVRRNLRAMRFLGIRHARSFPSIAAMLEEFSAALASAPEPVYLSIDKDVLAREVVQTNWDQGVMRLEELAAAIRMLQGRIIASDITGEVSSYRYRSRFKRFLSGLDRQPDIPEQTLNDWQTQHRQVNRQLLSLLSP